MAIPSYDGCMFPLLQILAKHPAGLRTRDAIDRTADLIGISDEDRRLLVPSARDPLYRNRIAWAHSRLKARGLSSAPRWGTWRITEAGLQFLKSHPNGIDEATARQFTQPESREVAPAGQSGAERRSNGDRALIEIESTPDERIGAAIEDLRRSVAAELLELLGRGSPEFFERAVLEVLHKMGYGSRDREPEHVGGVGDQGVDGVIYLDRLGLQKVCIQAKRWQGSVGPAEVQAFYGALAQKHAHHGVIITTSSFSRAAQEFAASVSEKIVLVNGAELADFMIDYGVGVSCESVQIPKVDRDFFDDA